MTLKDRTAVVTGAGSGLGRGIALALAAQGARVAAVDIDETTAKETAALIGKASGRAVALRADTSRAEDVDRAVTAAVKELGPLEIMVNNAGILDGYFNVDEMSEAVWRRTIDIDLTGVFLGCKRAIAEMLPRGRGPHHQHGLGGRAQRHRRRRRLHRRQARGGRPDPPDGGDLLRARHHRQLRVPGPDPHQPAPALAGDPRPRRARHERARRGRQRRADSRRWCRWAGAARWRTSRPRSCYLASDEAGYVTGHAMVVDGGWRAK